MSDAITVREGGFHEMAAANGLSVWWAGQGREPQRFDPATTGTDELVKLAGMEWRALRGKVRYAVDRAGTLLEMPEKHVLFRSDTKTPLGVVSDGYKVVQPAEVVHFFRDLLGAAGFELLSAGTVFGGKKVWAQARIGRAYVIKGQEIQGNLLVATALDGSMKTVVKSTTIDVVCANTLGFAMSETGAQQVSVSHRSIFDPEKVKKQLGYSQAGFSNFLDRVALLNSRDVISNEEFVSRLLKEEIEAEKHSRAWNLILDRIKNGAGQAARSGLWRQVSGVTDYVDHEIKASSDEHRFWSGQFGAGSDLKNESMDLAMELAA